MFHNPLSVTCLSCSAELCISFAENTWEALLRGSLSGMCCCQPSAGMSAGMDPSAVFQWPCPSCWSQCRWGSHPCCLPKHCQVYFSDLCMLQLLSCVQTSELYCNSIDTTACFGLVLLDFIVSIMLSFQR